MYYQVAKVTNLSTDIGNRFDWFLIIIDVQCFFVLFDFDWFTHQNVGDKGFVSTETDITVASDRSWQTAFGIEDGNRRLWELLLHKLISGDGWNIPPGIFTSWFSSQITTCQKVLAMLVDNCVTCVA